MKWKGVIPAITTCFNEKDQIDHGFVANHCRWLIENGCTGVVALGSLGEGATLSFDEKLAVLRTCVNALQGQGVGDRVHIVAHHSGGRCAGQSRGRDRLRRVDDSSAIRLPGRLARDENARCRRPEGD